MDQNAYNTNPPPNNAPDNELPTYQELAAQHGPNSRFGRWKGWVEKRAAERYADDTPERQQARRNKGWGPHVVLESPPESPPPPSEPPSPLPPLSRTQTVLSNLYDEYPEQDADPSLPPTTVQSLPPSHLELHTFGSRFLPHAEQPILSLLPICNDSMLLIGHANGLSVLDTEPESTSSELGATEPRCRDIWQGQGVYQLDLLEYEQSSSNTPKGVVLALVATDPPETVSDKENKGPHKVIRMYSLASLVNLARWACTRKSEALDATGLTDWQQAPKKSRSRTFRASKSEQPVSAIKLVAGLVDPDSIPPPVPPKDPPKSSVGLSPNRVNTGSSEWDVLERADNGLQWMTDYVPLASAGSRLVNQSVLFFELLRSPSQSRITARLAVATKQNILLYETVRGERAFRFVKEFYTPLPARNVTYVYQCPPDSGSSPRSAMTLTPTSTLSSEVGLLSAQRSRRISSPSTIMPLPAPLNGQLSLFVIFEKKAGVIRVSDSSVGEIDLWEPPTHSRRISSQYPSSQPPFRLAIGSFDSLSLTRESKGLWVQPAEISFPSAKIRFTPQVRTGINDTINLCLLTRGRITHVVPSPIPMPLSSVPPLKIIRWRSVPTRVVPRACERMTTGLPFLQVTAFSDDGVEVQEHALDFLDLSAGMKGKARDETVVVHADVGPGGTGFLCRGGHWSERGRQEASPGLLQRQTSVSTMDTIEMADRNVREQGMYGWTQKGFSDWRVFWLGGNTEEATPISSV